MKTLWNKFLSFIKEQYKKYKVYFYVGIAILGLLLYFNIKINVLKNRNETLKDDIKIKNELLDTMSTYKNKYGEITVEKLTLQGKISMLEKDNSLLSESQKELLQRIKENNNIISAALIKMQVKIDSLLSKNGTYDPKKQTLNFNDSTKDLNYDITVINARPFDTLVNTKLLFNNLSLPNRQYIEFKWEKEKDHPVSFSLSNSNIYFKTYDINSYAIPEIKKDVLKPNFWQKLNKFGNTTIGNGFKIGIGVGIGYLLFHK